jgi:hypothetical protein
MYRYLHSLVRPEPRPWGSARKDGHLANIDSASRRLIPDRIDDDGEKFLPAETHVGEAVVLTVDSRRLIRE